MDDWIEAGTHRYHVDGDMLYWCPDGEVLPEHVDIVCRNLHRITTQYGYSLWLVDALRSVPVGYDSRRRYAHWLTQWHGALFTASFRAALPARTTADLTARAVRMISSIELEIKNFATESEARSYLREQAAAQLQIKNTLRTADNLR